MFATLAAKKPKAYLVNAAPRVTGEHDDSPRTSPRRAAPSSTLQETLAVGAGGDPFEVEADRVSSQVLQASTPIRQASTRPAHPSSGHSNGQPLDSASRAFFEPRFGHDFSKVRIHADDQAAHATHSLGALAYTCGPNISFGNGRYQPSTGEGRRLLAHELTHVVQQGHAGVGSNAGVRIATGRPTPAIQRDTPKNQPDAPIGPVAGGNLGKESGVPRAEVTQALTDFLYRAQTAQGGQTLHVDDSVRWAVRKLFANNPMGSAQAEAFLDAPIHPGSAPEFAAAVTRMLPNVIPRANMAHLPSQAATDSPDNRFKSFGDAAGHVVVDSTVAPIVKKLNIPQKWKDTIVKGAQDAIAEGLVAVLDQSMSESPVGPADKAAIHSLVEGLIKKKAGTPMDRQQDGAGSPYAPWRPPTTTPPGFGSTKAPGEKIFSLPPIKWDIPTQDAPRPNLPQPAPAADAKAIESILNGLDDNSLIPAAAKGKPEAGNFAGAREFARAVANQLAEADKKKQSSVDLTISADYRHVEDLGEMFDKMAAIVRQIAAALPGGAATVSQVVLSPARNGPKDTIPARRIVRLHGGD